MESLLLPVREFGLQPPSNGKPAEALKQAKWHRQIQVLERVSQPYRIEE